MLEHLELDRDSPSRRAEIGQIDDHDRGAADVGADQALGFCDAIASDRGVDVASDFFRHGEQVPLQRRICRTPPVTASPAVSAAPIAEMTCFHRAEDHTALPSCERINRLAMNATSVRFLALSFFMMVLTCTLTVLSRMLSS